VDFVSRIKTLFDNADQSGRLIVEDDEKLHEKGLAGDRFYLAGSMNLTWTGVRIASEVVTLDLDPAEVARARRSYSDRYGGTFAEYGS
jgi:hypothetical protein